MIPQIGNQLYSMKSIEQTIDINLIKQVLSIDNMYDLISYDGSPSLKDFVPEGVWFLLLEESQIAGMITLKALNNVLWVPHIFIFEQFRKNGSEQWGTLVVDYMKKNYGAKCFIAITPYESAKKYAERMGFKYKTTLTQSIKKNNKLLDQYLLELE